MRRSEGLRTDVMKTSTRISRAGWAVAMMVGLGLVAGCGSSSGSGHESAAAKTKKAATHARDTDERATADMVAGVTPSKAGPPVALKFELRGQPEVGQPLDVDIAVLPGAPAINRIYGKFQGGEGLDLIDGVELPAIDKPAEGSVIRHVVRVLPKQDGIFTMSATVSVDLADDSITRTYSIPVIVGDGLAEQSAKTEVAEGGPAAGTVVKTH
ncbi:MAG TPA: hypothetical protein VI653_00240 [Steroidobacteraceae bacterium]